MKLKNTIVSLLMVSAVLMSFLAADISALSGKTVGEAESIIGGILDFELKKNGTADIQSWINGSITDNAGQSSEWYAIILSKSGNYDFSGYRNALKSYVSGNRINSATSRMKNALALLAVGEPPENLNDIAESSVGVQGIMSLIYGLHLLNNGCVCSGYTVASLTEELLSLQFEDGGWAIMGSNGDIDVTAMTVQALAPQYDSNKDAASAIDRAVSFMSAKQLDNGGYISFGTENPESTAQVLIALAQLGIGIDDERFVKNGSTVIDGMLRFVQPDGSFAHTLDGGSNDTATTQVLMALTAYVIAEERGEKLYLFDTADNAGSSRADDVVVSAGTTAAAETSAAAVESPPVTDVTGGPAPRAVTPPAGDPADGNAVGGGGSPASGYKPIAYIIIGSTVLIACVILFVLKKRRISNFVAVFIVGAGAAAFIFFTDFRSSEEYYNGADTVKTDIIGKVTLAIRCDTAVGKINSQYVPSDGIILDTTSFDLSEGESVYDILTQAARKYNIQLETGANGYVSGIGYLYEFDCGDLSGWIYHVNDDTPFVMCSEYKLSDGDKVEWLYTCDLGNDL